MQQAPN